MSLSLVSSISRVLRARFGKKDDDDDCDKKDEDGEKKTKHSIDGILGDKGNSVIFYLVVGYFKGNVLLLLLLLLSYWCCCLCCCHRLGLQTTYLYQSSFMWCNLAV